MGLSVPIRKRFAIQNLFDVGILPLVAVITTRPGMMPVAIMALLAHNIFAFCQGRSKHGAGRGSSHAGPTRYLGGWILRIWLPIGPRRTSTVHPGGNP